MRPLLIIFVLILSGCSAYDDLLRRVPSAEFESFTYHRGGNLTSATVTAINAKKEGNSVTVDDVHITTDYGPFVNFDIQLKGWKRELGE